MSKTRNECFIHDEKTSSLYSPNGAFLKKVFCPKALHWNQLIVEDEQDRWPARIASGKSANNCSAMA